MENECRIKMIDLGRQFQESLPKRTTAASIPVLDDPPGKQWEGLRGGGEVRGLRHALSICVGHRRRHGDGHAGVDNRRCHGDSATSAILGSAKHLDRSDGDSLGERHGRVERSSRTQRLSWVTKERFSPQCTLRGV
eukprot:6210562-Pleurochrysis_carterae.AAC.8